MDRHKSTEDWKDLIEKPIPYGRQDISEDDISAVMDVLRSDFLTQGPKVPEFEFAVSQYCGSKYSVAVNSATSALHIACLALGAGVGDVIWTSPITFVASANAALYCGADIDFVDIDPATYNMSPTELRIKLVAASLKGKLPKIVIAVHFAGQSCDMREIYALSKEYKFKVIEDASHAIGGEYLGKKVGSCEYSDVCIFSFHPVKIITTAEGGMALTNNESLAQKMQLLRSHGITRDESQMKVDSDGPWYYQQIELGFNYRMTEMQAALGISQMTRLDRFILERRRLAAYYDSHITVPAIRLPFQALDSISSYHLYPIWLNQELSGICRGLVFEKLRALGIGVNVHYIPVHTQPFFQDRGFKKGQFPVAESYYSGAISIPLYAGLGDDILRVVDAINVSIKR